MRRTVLGLAVWVGTCGVGWGQGVGAEQVPAPGEQQADGGGIVARAARLTYLADGGVRVTREDDPEGSAGVLNMPLAQGSRVATGERAQAEIEFEDGSVVRLTPGSAVRLEYLGSEGDAKVTSVRVMGGLVYCELRASGRYRFSVLAGAETVWPLENTTVRVNMDEPPGGYAVLAGSLMVVHGTGEGAGYRTEVRAGESLRGDRTNGSRYFLTSSVPAERWDNWNEGRDQAALNALASETSVRTGFAGAQGYGWSDLDAGGRWYEQGEQAPVWQPAEALAADFDPYGYGSWSYFPGGGYTWASGYAWGWTPYRCGRWRYWDRFGWGWQPDGACRTNWRYGVGGGNVYGGPRGYVPVRVPVRRPVGVHPILQGPHPGERPPTARGTWEQGEREIGGVKVRPIGTSGQGVTSRGGSAVGSALRRDYGVDERTRRPEIGVVADPARVRPPAGAVGVTLRPEPPVGEGDVVRGVIVGAGRTADVRPVRGSGYGDVVPTRGRDWDTGRTGGPTTVHAEPVRGPVRPEPEPVMGNSHTQPVVGPIRSQPVRPEPGNSHLDPVRNEVPSRPVMQPGSHPQPGPQPGFRSPPAAPAAPRMEMRVSPAAPAATSAAAPKK